MTVPMKFFLAATAALALIPVSAQANRAGRAGLSEMGCGGVGCHDGAGSAPTLELQGPTMLDPGQTGDFTLIVNGDGVVAGANLSSDGGELAAGDDSTLRAVAGELVHAGRPQDIIDGQAAFMFRWTAPETAGTYELFIAGNNNDGDATASGDNWTTEVYTLTVGDGGGAGGMNGGAGGGTGGDTGGDDDDGGSCSTAPHQSGPWGLAILALVGMGLIRRRRA